MKMTPTELYDLQIENTQLEAKLDNLRLKREIAEMGGDNPNRVAPGNAVNEEFDFAQAVERSVAGLNEKIAEESAQQGIGTIESEEAQGFRILTDGLTERQMDNLVRIAQLMRETGIDKIAFGTL
jgi:hypothetical protein